MAVCLSSKALGAITISIDCSLDSNNLFSDGDGATSVLLSDGSSQETAMDPDVTAGTRKYLTNLDAMGLADIGWQLNITTMPEPSIWALVSGIALLGFGAVRRYRLNPLVCKSSQ